MSPTAFKKAIFINDGSLIEEYNGCVVGGSNIFVDNMGMSSGTAERCSLIVGKRWVFEFPTCGAIFCFSICVNANRYWKWKFYVNSNGNYCSDRRANV